MKQLHPHSSFVVNENKGLSIVMSLIFTAMFVYSLTDKVGYDYEGKFKFKFLYFALLPALFFLLKAMVKRPAIITINRKGFYYYQELITDWDHFIDAKVTQDQKLFTLRDNFVLFIRYRNDEGKLFRSKIPLTNNQDKSEEEIIAAIKFYRHIYRSV